MLGDAKDGAGDPDDVEVKARSWLADIPGGLDGRAPEDGTEEINDILQGNKDDAELYYSSKP